MSLASPRLRSLAPTLKLGRRGDLYLDHSHCPVLAPASLAALPSTRAIETRSLPTSLAATHLGFAFYVALPKSSIPSIATCSMSLIPSLHSQSPARPAWSYSEISVIPPHRSPRRPPDDVVDFHLRDGVNQNQRELPQPNTNQCGSSARSLEPAD